MIKVICCCVLLVPFAAVAADPLCFVVGVPGTDQTYGGRIQIQCVPLSPLVGPAGPAGPVGPAGPQGIQGPVGPQGPAGTALPTVALADLPQGTLYIETADPFRVIPLKVNGLPPVAGTISAEAIAAATTCLATSDDGLAYSCSVPGLSTLRPGIALVLVPRRTNAGPVSLSINGSPAIGVFRQSRNGFVPGELYYGMPRRILYEGTNSDGTGTGAWFVEAADVTPGRSGTLTRSGGYTPVELDVSSEVCTVSGVCTPRGMFDLSQAVKVILPPRCTESGQINCVQQQ